MCADRLVDPLTHGRLRFTATRHRRHTPVSSAFTAHTLKRCAHGGLSAAPIYPRSPSLSAVSMATCRLHPQRIDETKGGAQKKAGRAISAPQVLAVAEPAWRPNVASRVEPRRRRKLRQLTGKLSNIPTNQTLQRFQEVILWISSTLGELALC